MSGSSKSTLVTRVLAELVRAIWASPRRRGGQRPRDRRCPRLPSVVIGSCWSASVRSDALPAPTCHLHGPFDAVRKLYAAASQARESGHGADRFPFNAAEGRCETCQGGCVSVELLFLPGTYASCPTCRLSCTSPSTLGEGGLGSLRLGGPTPSSEVGCPADHVGDRTAAGSSRARDAPARRVDCRAIPRRHRSAVPPSAPGGGRRQHQVLVKHEIDTIARAD